MLFSTVCGKVCVKHKQKTEKEGRGAMKFLKNKVLIAFCTVALALTIFLSVFSIMGLTPYISGAVNAVCTPFQWCVSKVKSGFSGFSAYFSSVEELQKENRELKEEMQSLRAELDRQKYATEENVALRRYMHIAVENTSYRFADAQVIARESEGYMTVFKVDKGKKDGIREKMAVITKQGVVGYVSSVSEFTCKITAIIETGTSVGAYIPVRGAYGILQGTYNDKADGVARMSYVDENAVVYVGDAVYTNGDGSVYPRGLLIGSVSGVGHDAYSRTLRITVRPAVDFENIDRVMILTDFTVETEQETSEAGTEQAS